MTLAATLAGLGLHLLAGALPGHPTLPAGHPLAVRATAAAAEVAAEVAASTLPPADREAYARALYAWAFHESGWQANPKGSNDQGSACGVLQVHTPEAWLPGATCTAVRADRRLGFRVGLVVVRLLAARCGGSLRDGLVAFSTNGMCPKPGWTIELVTRRMREAGLASDGTVSFALTGVP